MDKVLMYNPTFSVGFLSFLLAQILKTLHYAIKFKTFNKERIYGAGGMPSSHSSLVISVLVYTFRLEGGHGSAFAFTILIAGIVIFDALSVRYNAGLHAKELNRLNKVIDKLEKDVAELKGEELPEENRSGEAKPLKEFLGHTIPEVLAGALLGILMGAFWPLPKVL